MIEIVGVRFDKNLRIYYFDPAGKKYYEEQQIIVETVNGLEVATVVIKNRKVDKHDVVLPLKKVIRLVDADDKKRLNKNKQLCEKAANIFQKMVKEEQLDLQFVAVKYNFEGTHVTFSYTAEKRVDFRQLLKKLAGRLHMRIEMRQINAREKARMIGGIGPCGYDLCCSTFLHDLQGATIKMVKNQKLSLVPERISGNCGKLLCCLRYENDVYTELATFLPDVNQTIDTPEGVGKVVYVNVLTKQVDVLVEGSKGQKVRKQYHYDDVKKELLEAIGS